MTHRRATAALALLSALVSAPVHGQGTPVWSHDAHDKIAVMQLTPLGTLMIGTPGALTALDPESGRAQWASALRVPENTWVSTVPESPYGVVFSSGGFVLLDLVTGRPTWNTGDLGLDHVHGFLSVPDRRIMLIYGGRGTGLDSSLLVAADLDSGRLIWEHVNPFVEPPKRFRELVPGTHRSPNILSGSVPPLWASDTTFLLHISPDGPALLHHATGARLWRADSLRGRRPPAVRDWYPPLLATEQLAFIPSDDRLYAIRLSDGSPAWPRPAKFPSRIVQMEVTPRGLLVRGQRRPNDAPADKAFVDLLDPQTGVSAWRKRFERRDDYFTRFVVRGERAYVVAKNKLFALGLGDGVPTEVARIRFRGEDPSSLEWWKDGFVLLGSQNLMLVDTSGAVRYHAYHPAPAAGWLTQLAYSVLSLALDVISAELAQSQARRTGVYQTYEGLNPFLRLRHEARQNARQYVYILTTEEDSTGRPQPVFVKLNKDNGQVEGRAWLSDRSPDYVLDRIGGMLYVKEGETRIVAFRM